MGYETVREAAEHWVSRFNALPTRMIEKLYCNDPDEWEEVTVLTTGDLDFESVLPMWGTMWSFDDSADNWWLEEDDGLRKMSDCGFRIFHNEEFGYFFGIDGGGYDFYEEHWVPLYTKRRLQWHKSS